MRTKVASFFIFFQELSNKKKIKALRPKMTKIASRGSCLKSVGRRTAQLVDRLPWQPEVATESFKFLNVCTTFATGDKSNLRQRDIFDALSKKNRVLGVNGNF